jgi:penicillin-binding protein 1C
MLARLSAEGQWLLPVRAEELGFWLPKVAVAIEDGRFWSHPGVDPLALARALGENLLSGRVVSGASTITAQTVRLLQPRPRSLWAKYLEFGQALRLERSLAKNQILELYLNIAPFGGNLKGVGAAAWAYFQKRPRDLSLAESVTLIAILRGPALYRPDRHPERARRRRDILLRRLAQKGVISSHELQIALAEPLVSQRRPFPDQAPHFGEQVFRRHPRLWVWGGADYQGLKVSLDARAQASLETRLTQALRDFPPVVTAAGIILEPRTGEILAYVGNARPQGPFGFVDCAQAKRSPGSTLKPFLYLAAIQEGLLVPASLLADTPHGLGGQAPRNFDGRYQGPVSARLALAESLNAPAIRVLRLLGQTRAQASLSRAGFTLNPKRDYGDSLALGGSEATLGELARAYGALANQGRAQESRLTPATAGEGARVSPGLELFSPEASWLINQILAEPGRLPTGLAIQGLAFKTGTSHGYRDAWLVAYHPDRVVALWLGDPSGQGHPGVSGLAALATPAALLARDLGPVPAWPQPPAGVSAYQACPLSGEPAGPLCPVGRSAWRLTRFARTQPCQLHVRQAGRTVIHWPRELAAFMAKKAGSSVGRAEAMITSPLPGATIRLTREGEALPLKSEGALGPVWWYVDGEFFAVAGPGRTPILPLTPGQHVVTLVDNQNQTAKSEFRATMALGSPEVPILRVGPDFRD